MQIEIVKVKRPRPDYASVRILANPYGDREEFTFAVEPSPYNTMPGFRVSGSFPGSDLSAVVVSPDGQVEAFSRSAVPELVAQIALAVSKAT